MFLKSMLRADRLYHHHLFHHREFIARAENRSIGALVQPLVLLLLLLLLLLMLLLLHANRTWGVLWWVVSGGVWGGVMEVLGMRS